MASVTGVRGLFGEGAITARTRNPNPNPSPVFEDFEPSQVWTEDSNGHYLLVDLPDFKKEQVKIQVNSLGHIKINGERPVNESKRIRFERTFKAPDKSNTDAITAKFDGEAQILYITVPKHKTEEIKKEEPKPIPIPIPIPLPQPQPETYGQKEQQKENDTTQEISASQKPDGHHEAQIKDDITQGCDAKDKDENSSSLLRENVRRWDCEPAYYLKSAIEMLSKNKGIVVTAMVAFSLGMFVSRRFESEGIGE